MATHRKRIFAPAAVFCLGISLVALVHAGPGDVPVISMVSDYDTGIAPALQIQSDQLGVYRHSKTLVSLIQSVGSWVLDSYPAYVRGATRSIYLGFNQPIAGSGLNGGAPTPPPSGNYQAHVISKCNSYNNSMLAMAPGTTMPCPLHVHFDADGDTYDIHMNPYAVNVPSQHTNYANITCIYPSSGSGSCSQWKIAPSGTLINPDGTVTYRNIGVLHKTTTSKGKTTMVKQGDFYFSFLIVVSK